ncbi:hypothetical protein [uncultured Chryseobacterium sp.]|uniref:hypothetical protein n=1 Tax=uncultured Chryseobacterium sp. TaxID=259322 RepID=UPI003747D87C
MKRIAFYLNKSTLLSGYLANFQPKNYEDILEIAYESVIAGNAKVNSIIERDSTLFGKNTLKSLLLNNAIIDLFRSKILANEKTKHRVKFFETFRMTFALVDNKFFLCFKALGKENTIEGMKTKRFEDIREGNPFTMSKKMYNELKTLNLTDDLPPILFVCFRKSTDYIDFINLQHYFDGDVSLEFKMKMISNFDLNDYLDDMFKPKNDKKNKDDEDDDQLSLEIV